MFLDFKKWVWNEQAAGYNGACTVVIFEKVAPICLVKNKNVRFTTISFLQGALSTDCLSTHCLFSAQPTIHYFL